ncbi:MAG: HmuY family protein [Polyangiales bacterium]
MKQQILGSCLGVILVSGCASKLSAKGAPEEDARPLEDADASAADGGGPVELVSGKFTTTREPGVPSTTVVDATVQGEWQRFDLDSGESAEADAGWDLGFNRYFVIGNGGVSGDDGVEVALLKGQAFDDVTSVPSDGFAADAEDGEDGNTEADNTFNGTEVSWYNYDMKTHELTPRDATYVIRSSEGTHFKLRIDDYYDDAGTPAYLRFTWAPLAD